MTEAKKMTWQEVVLAMQQGAAVIGWLDKTDPRRVLVLWSIDGQPLADSWRDDLPLNLVRTRPGGPGKPFTAYLTERGQGYRPDTVLVDDITDLVEAHTIRGKGGEFLISRFQITGDTCQ